MCPCGLKDTYDACCGRFHRGLTDGVEPETPEALMRSRFSAFVKRELDYLYLTLHSSHDDRARAPEEWRHAVEHGLERLHYEALEILETTEPDRDEVATVTFRVELFEVRKEGRGKKKKNKRVDLSFTECSRFAKEEGGWRYLFGESVRTT